MTPPGEAREYLLGSDGEFIQVAFDTKSRALVAAVARLRELGDTVGIERVTAIIDEANIASRGAGS